MHESALADWGTVVRGENYDYTVGFFLKVTASFTNGDWYCDWQGLHTSYGHIFANAPGYGTIRISQEDFRINKTASSCDLAIGFDWFDVDGNGEFQLYPIRWDAVDDETVRIGWTTVE